MAKTDVIVPDIGDYKDVPVIEVLVKDGQRVEKDSALITLESEKATMEGVVRAPSAFSMTFASFPSMTETQEFVVPRSIPITFAMSFSP